MELNALPLLCAVCGQEGDWEDANFYIRDRGQDHAQFEVDDGAHSRTHQTGTATAHASIAPMPKSPENAPAAGAGVDREKETQPTVPAGGDKQQGSYPAHPISQLQGPFEESIVETKDESSNEWVVDLDAQSRRRDLLENDKYERLCGRKWRQRESERYHPFWKLISQMTFGVHLLAKGLAKSELEVLKILQGHVDELDGFLERTTEDYMLIRLDVHTRIQYLSLPLGNLDVFDEMLQDRSFRLSIVSYNDQIEHAINRFMMSITDSLKDIRKGKEAMGALWHYVRRLAAEGCFESEGLRPFYQAMIGNMEGWVVTFSKLRRQGTSLQKALSQLALAVTEMQRRVGVASRKDAVSSHLEAFMGRGSDSNKRSLVDIASRGANSNRPLKHKLFRGSARPLSRSNSDKPLPRDPSLKPKPKRPPPAGSKHTNGAPPPGEGNLGPGSSNVAKQESANLRILNRAKSCNNLAGEAKTDTEPPPIGIPGRLTKKLSKTFLPKRSEGEKRDTTETRPVTAPSSKGSRNVSMEQFKDISTTGPPPLPTSQSVAKSPMLRQQAPQQSSDSQDSMKDQISHYLKGDRVIEAWDNMTRKPAGSRPSPAKPKDWPLSMFRAKSMNNLRTQAANDANLPSAGLRRQMSWVHDAPELLNTYSFKPKPDLSPRIHVSSVLMNLDESLDRVCDRDEVPGAGDGAGYEAGSIITALPAVPLPPPSPPSVSLLKLTTTVI